MAIANYYCNEHYLHAATFSELCSAAQFRIIIQLLYIPVIAVGSILIVAAIVIEKELHTSHHFVLLAIAVTDFFIGVVVCPVYMLKVFPETVASVGSNKWSCLLIHIFQITMDSLSFDLFTLMCVERFLKIWKPIWGIAHLKNPKNILIAIVGIIAFRLALCVLFICLNAVGTESEEEWSVKICLGHSQTRPKWRNIMGGAIFYIEILVSYSMCVAVVVLVAHRYRQRRLSKKARKAYVKAKVRSTIMLSLMFVFLVLWLPSCVSLISYELNHVTGEASMYIDVSLVVRFINSGVNVFLYALTDHLYRDSFKLLLTTPPWRFIVHRARSIRLERGFGLKKVQPNHESWRKASAPAKD